ncbi:MAG: peptide chain release factor family protein [Thermodesulfovibrionales bacterium]
MPEFAVSPEKNRWLKEKMKSLNIREEDILEKFVRSSGKGGQKVNKSSSCVYLKHLPSGIEIKCMKDRSQSINRFLARRELIERIEEKMGIEKTEVSKIRKKKAKARKRAERKYRGKGPED